MKKSHRFILAIVIFTALAAPAPAYARGMFDDRVVFGGNFVLESGETLEGSLVIFGGNARLEEGSIVDGDVVLMGGNLDASGDIRRSVVGLGGNVSLSETAVVESDIVLIGAQLSRAAGARVEGDVVSDFGSPLSFTFPGGVQVPRFDMRFSPFVNAAGFFLKLLLWTALAVLMVLFLPEHTRRVGKVAISQPLIAGGIGLLTVAVLPVIMLALIITILLIPVSLIVAALAAIAWIFGLIALGMEVGKRLAELAKQEWAPAVSAGLGTFVLIFVLNGLDMLIPCAGWVFPALAGMLGLGAVLLTRFGMQDYPLLITPSMPPAPSAPPSPPAPPAPPE